MSPADQDRVIVVLVRARNPSNIGAVARAMHDLGFRDLRLVNEFALPFQAARSAVDASSVMQAAQEFPTVAQAVADCTFVLGTTAVGERALQHPLHLLPDAVPLVANALALNPVAKIALLFGSEKTGLSNDELSHCHALLTIPMNPRAPRHLSMNLGQAVAVCLYALAQQPPGTAAPTPEPPATAAGLERLTTLLREAMDASGYTRRHPANAREANVRRLLHRMHLSASDAPVWTGIFRQMLHAVARPPAPPTSGASSNSSGHGAQEPIDLAATPHPEVHL